MKFIVDDKVFSAMENICFGVVLAKNINNVQSIPACTRLLQNSIKLVEEKFSASKAKEAPEILPYREAFRQLGMNPNKYMSSIEAMASRIEKKKGFPAINPIVDLGNAISLKYLVPLGAHDVESGQGEICVRFSRQGDSFVPFGGIQAEVLEDGELIYSVGDKVKTRRWIWRQSEVGKVTEQSQHIFFPIDGFGDKNKGAVLDARDELATCLEQIFKGQVQVGFVDTENRYLEID